MQLDELQNPAQRETWEIILQHGAVVLEVEEDEVDEGYLVMQLDPATADAWGIYGVLSISPEGTVAEYMVNQPYHWDSFSKLLMAAAVRTSAS